MKKGKGKIARLMANAYGPNWYDTKKGIARSLSDLKLFTTLIGMRHEVKRETGKDLNEYYILGRFCLDNWGNTSKIIGDLIPKDVFPEIPDVLTRDEFWKFINERVANKAERSITTSLTSCVPDHERVCPVCKKHWTINNCHDMILSTTSDFLPLDELIGRTLLEVKQYYAMRTNARYFMQNDILIRNPRFIDLTPLYPNATLDWEKDVVKNIDGRVVDEKHGIDDSYIIQADDEGFFHIFKYYHGDCYRQQLLETEQNNTSDKFVNF